MAMGAQMSDEARMMEGRRLGVYQVQALLGAGGMGEVYRARDTKLERDVAIKVVRSAFTSDPDRLARFEREARMLAALNHPNIGAIYGLEEAEGIRFLILELVDGETLADKLAVSRLGSRGRGLPVRDALHIARQIAEALDVAHEKGIIHRDLKPANIKITPDGVVKVLDFGLAKAAGAADSTPELTHSPTMDGTRDGAVMGTAGYMSPEQARGQAIDKRTDIWAFGCVLYETLTGQVAFKGDTMSDTIVAVLGSEPEWDALPEATPASVRLLLQRCLDKDPKRRLRDFGDVRFEVDELDSRSSGVATGSRERDSRPSAIENAAAPVARQWRPTSRAVALIVLPLLLLAGGLGLFTATRPSLPVTSPSEYAQLTNFTDSATAPSLSPDGRMVAFKRGSDPFLGSGQIYVKLLPNGESVRLTSDADPKYGPVFTPDGSRIAYTSLASSGPALAWDTWTVPVLGGQPVRLLPNASGLTWIADHLVLFSEVKNGIHMGIVTATESRAGSREIYFPPSEFGMVHYSYASPDRQSVLAVEMDQTHAFHEPCRLLPFDGSSPGRQVGPRGTCMAAAWSPDGRWMYFSAVVDGSSHLWRQRFPAGAPEQITFGPTEEEGIALAPDGRSLVTSIGTRRSATWMHDAAGERSIISEGYSAAPRLSRDGTRVFYLLVRDWWLSAAGSSGWVPSSAELRSVDLASGKSDSVLSGQSLTSYALSQDEKDVAFTTTDASGESQIWLAPLDRRTPPRLIARAGDQVSFGAAGELIFRSLGEDNALVRIKEDGTGRVVISSLPVTDKFDVSPDGEWVIIFSAGTGGQGTFAIPINGGPPRRICDDCSVAWSADGRLFYVGSNLGALATSAGQTLAIPVPAGKSLPDLPGAGIEVAARVVGLPGARMIEHGPISPGPDPSTYVFTKTDLQRNLFRIPLH